MGIIPSIYICTNTCGHSHVERLPGRTLPKCERQHLQVRGLEVILTSQSPEGSKFLIICTNVFSE